MHYGRAAYVELHGRTARPPALHAAATLHVIQARRARPLRALYIPRCSTGRVSFVSLRIDLNFLHSPPPTHVFDPRLRYWLCIRKRCHGKLATAHPIRSMRFSRTLFHRFVVSAGTIHLYHLSTKETDGVAIPVLCSSCSSASTSSIAPPNAWRSHSPTFRSGR